jgi:hypothetical protein
MSTETIDRQLGWIAFAERKPTEADTRNGRVFVASAVDGWSGAIALSDALLGLFPYWMPIPAIPQTQQDIDREEAERVYKDATFGKEQSIAGFLAGIRHARAEREGTQ